MNTTLKTLLATATATAIGGIALMQPAVAANVTSSFQVKLHVNASCKFTTSPILDLDFGSRDMDAAGAAKTPVLGTSDFSVQCTKGTTPVVKLSSANSWNMIGKDTNNSGKTIAYNLYQDPSRTLAWDATKGPSVTNDGVINPFTVYGKVNSVGDIAGNFADVVTVTLDF